MTTLLSLLLTLLTCGIHLQGPDYFENVAQEQQGPARRQRRLPARFRDGDGAGGGFGAQLAQLQA